MDILNLYRYVLATSVLSLACSCATADSVGGWALSNAYYNEGKIQQLDHAIAADVYKHINSLIVIHNGKLLIERYYNGADRDSTHNPRSVGKTFVTPVLGIAIEQGYIGGLDQQLSDFYELKSYANFSEKKNRVMLGHLLTMTSGFDGFDFDAKSIGNEENMYPQDDWVRWTLNLPMAKDREPGEAWRYFTAGIVVLGDILNKSVPGGLENYADQVLFSPLGISNYEWQHTPQRVANTAGGVQLTPLGFAKFGELHRTRGRWGDRQLVSSKWMEAALQPGTVTTEDGNRYGYLWWYKSFAVDGQQWPTAYCSGNGGNKIFVFDEQALVVVITASAYGQRYAHRQVDEMMERYILPAVQAISR